jgi:negative regulator of flagellin synthesis FlgM
MNISSGIENLAQILPAQTAPAAAAVKSSNPPQSEGLEADKAKLSVVATQVAQSAATSDVRLDKVASIQNALQAGTYEVSASDVAQKVMASMLAPGK